MALHTLPAQLAHQAAVAFATFHDSMTPTTERNRVVTDLLQELRQHDPNLSVWDLLHVFDALNECPRCGLINGHRYPCAQ